jgi:hypothetical protein
VQEKRLVDGEKSAEAAKKAVSLYDVFNYPALFKHHQKSRHPRATQSDYALSQPSALSRWRQRNKMPMEILTGKEQAKDWISILFDISREKDPQLLLAS